MRRSHGQQPRASSAEETAFSFGYFYRSIEDHINAFAAQNGGAYTFSAVASRVSRLLEGASLRESLRDSELVSQVRTNGARAGLQGAAGAGEALHVRPHGGRPLSVAARASIARAQRKRWRKQKRAAALQAKSAKPDTLTPAQRKRSAKGVSAFWAKMTPEERSKEVLRRQKVAAAKKAAKAVA